jgi:hypothetical protein
VATTISTVFWGVISSKLRTTREPLFAGFVIYTAGFIGWTTIQPGDNLNSLVFGGLAGIGFGAPLILIVATVQLVTPHKFIATATSVITTSRAVAASVFTAIYAAALNSELTKNLPKEIGDAALEAGLPSASLPAFIADLANSNTTALSGISGVTPAIIAAGVAGLQQAYADSLRVVFIIAVPFGLVACILCFFLGDLRDMMNYKVEAPVEELHAKHHHHHHGATPA